MSTRKITLRIGRITVDGSGHDKRVIAETIEHELRHGLSEPGAVDMLRNSRWSSHVDGGRVQPQGTDSGALGRAIGRATFGALSR